MITVSLKYEKLCYIKLISTVVIKAMLLDPRLKNFTFVSSDILLVIDASIETEAELKFLLHHSNTSYKAFYASKTLVCDV